MFNLFVFSGIVSIYFCEVWFVLVFEVCQIDGTAATNVLGGSKGIDADQSRIDSNQKP